MNSKAFSLIEILVVISIIFLISTTSFYRFSFFDKFLVKNETQHLFNAMSFLQQKAISSNTNQQLFFDLKNNCYFYFSNNKKNNHKLANKVKFDFIKGILGPPSAPSKTIKKITTFKRNKDGFYFATFHPNGQIDTGTIYLVDKRYKSMFAVTSPISQVSYLRKYQHLKNKWILV